MSKSRRRDVELPQDPSDEELARDWSLSTEDRGAVLRCRGDDKRLSFALQLCVVRRFGRFLVDYDGIPVRIINHLGRQLDLPPVLLVEAPSRVATDIEHQRRLREHLTLETFTDEVRERLERSLAERATEGMASSDLVALAEGVLRSWKVVLPARSTLSRLAGSVWSRMQDETFRKIDAGLGPVVSETIDDLLRVKDGRRRSTLFDLKAYPPEPRPDTITTYLERYQLLRSLAAVEEHLEDVSPTLVRGLAELVRRYGAHDLKRFSAPKRRAMVACFLAESRKTVLDHLVAMHDKYMTSMSRRARLALEKRQKKIRPRATKGLDTVLRAVDILLDPERQRETVVTELYLEISEDQLRHALKICQKFKLLQERGMADELCARHSHLKRYFPGFLELPFEAEPGGEKLLYAVRIARQLNAGELKRLPETTPLGFVPRSLLGALWDKKGRLDRRVWEIALAFALREALRAGRIYLPESRHHVSFWQLVYNETRWNQERKAAYRTLALPTEPRLALERLKEQFDAVASATRAGLADNPFATIENGRLKLKREDALEIPPRVKELRRLFETRLSRVRIEDVLLNVDSWCSFSRALWPLRGYESRPGSTYETLLAAIVAHGTNLGIATMSQSAVGISADMLQHASRWFLHPDALKASNTALVNFHHGQPLSSVWGEGTASSSDGQRFGIEASSLMASLYPRYFGHYDRAITVYTHLSDQHSVFGSTAISCAPREALYVLDGLLENDTVLKPVEHYTDTHGYTEQLFGLCYLLGYSFMPRFKDLADQRLYCFARSPSHQELSVLFRGSVDPYEIAGEWDQLVRVVASLRNRTAPAHVVVQRLAANAGDRLSKALRGLGRIVKTIYILRYIHEPAVRRRVQLHLNRGEQRHKLGSRLFFANQGVFRVGDYAEIMNKVSCLALLSNAVLVWNTVKMAELIGQLQASGEDVEDEDMARVSPLLHKHVIPNGTYRFRPPTGGGRLCV